MSETFIRQLDAIKKANLSADRNMEMQMLVIVLRLMREMKAESLEIVIQKRAWDNGFDMPGLLETKP
jgi:biopolymer transport protein ExbD